VLVVVALIFIAPRARGVAIDPQQPVELAATLARAGERVEAFFSRAQSLICTETVSIQPLNYGLAREGFARTVESELRLWWETNDGPPATTAQVRRQVVSVNRRPPKKNDPNNCTVQEQQETETQPLSMLLPEQRRDYAFSHAGTTRLDGRAAIMVDFRHLTPVSIDVQMIESNENCVGYELNGGMRGRLWFDGQTLDVLRLDQRLAGLVDLRLPRILARRPGAESHWTLERWDTSIRFGSVTFRDPDESLVLPLSSTTLRITRGSGTPRLRTETKYADYKRFLTGGRIIGDEGHAPPR
jgi:hypothetical protein